MFSGCHGFNIDIAFKIHFFVFFLLLLLLSFYIIHIFFYFPGTSQHIYVHMVIAER